ncbi:MAG: phosphatidylserine decarboxylase [Parachlamydiales bacterium]|nr:phosphatidylserine decarboxylase [Parachlamydiales bacterium]
MEPIIVYDRKLHREVEEKVYGREYLESLYGTSLFSPIVKNLLLPFIRMPFASKAYAKLSQRASSKKKIESFVKEFQIDPEEFEKNIEDFSSFYDFFVRHLKPSARPISQKKDAIIAPADARYLVFPKINAVDGFYVKGAKFTIQELLQDKELAKKYESGSMVIARLAPTDYHRFHFPIDAVPAASWLINGYLYSVNPIAVKKNIKIFTENKRMITPLNAENWKMIFMVEIGATNVGSIVQTYTSDYFYQKGDEKGFFGLGGSTIILLFEEGEILLDPDLIEMSEKKIETKILMGDTIATKMPPVI